MAKRWQCTVCGYIHDGDAPPEFCPICGADRSQFVLLGENKGGLLREMIEVFRLHRVLAHFPNGLVPTAALLLLLHIATGWPGLEAGAFWLLAVVVGAAPVTAASGLFAWKKQFGGQRAPIFVRKIALALALLALGVLVVALRHGQPELLATPGWARWAYLLALAGMFGCVVLLGHYGGMLASRAVKDGDATGPLLPLDRGQRWTRDLVTQAPDAILIADATGIIRLWNRGAERIFGLAAEQAIGQSLNLIIPENLRQRHWEGWNKVMQSGISRYGDNELLRVPAIRADGQRISAEFSIVMLRDAAGQIDGIAAILRDVTAQWTREKALKNEVASLRDNLTKD